MVYLQVSVFGPSRFNINTLDMFFKQKNVNFVANTVDNTQYFCDKKLEVLLSKLQICALKVLESLSDNYMKINSDKCHHILSSYDETKNI